MARLKVIPVSIPFWEMVVIEGSVIRTKCVEGLPEGAMLVNSYYDGERQTVNLVYCHESFEDLPIGAILPKILPIFESLE